MPAIALIEWRWRPNQGCARWAFWKACSNIRVEMGKCTPSYYIKSWGVDVRAERERDKGVLDSLHRVRVELDEVPPIR